MIVITQHYLMPMLVRLITQPNHGVMKERGGCVVVWRRALRQLAALKQSSSSSSISMCDE